MDVLMEDDVTAAAKTPPPDASQEKLLLADHLTPTDLEKEGGMQHPLGFWSHGLSYNNCINENKQKT